MNSSRSAVTKEIANKAWLALLEEVYTTPKPGLVDLYSCGAHKDMNVTTFEKSAKALYPYFLQMAELGYEMQSSPEKLFQTIRQVGKEAEKAMYGATGGVNTHKGIIFTVGIFCAAAGRCMQEAGQITEKLLFYIEQQMVAGVLTEEVKAIEIRDAKSNGEKNLKTYGTAGVRGEAIEGYPTIQNIALPVLKQGISDKKEWNLVKLQTLFSLMSQVEDSNIISRHNPQTLSQIHTEAKEFLKQGGAYAKEAIKKLKKMDEDYIHRNISAGGCADLLASAIFLNLLLSRDHSVIYTEWKRSEDHDLRRKTIFRERTGKIKTVS